MRKTSTYARKCAMRRRQDEQERLLQLIIADLRGLQIDAGLHAWTGEDAAKMVNLAGRLCYITAFASVRSGVDVADPDVRIIRGMAGSLADLAADLDALERYRPSLQSGLAAIDRLLPMCDVLHLVEGASELDLLLATTGLGTANVHEALGVMA